MKVRHAFVAMGPVGCLTCGWLATVSAFTSDAMSSALASRGALRSKSVTAADEIHARHHDDNIDDISAPSNLGLTVDIEMPRELKVPLGRRVGTNEGFS